LDLHPRKTSTKFSSTSTGATASRFAAGELAHLSPPSHAPLLGGLGEPESASAVISEQARRKERLRTQNAALESKARVLEATQAKLGAEASARQDAERRAAAAELSLKEARNESRQYAKALGFANENLALREREVPHGCPRAVSAPSRAPGARYIVTMVKPYDYGPERGGRLLTGC
jgi:hypothetical protein